MNNFQPQRKFNNKVWMTKLEKSPFDAKPCRSTKGIPYAVFFDREDVMWQCSIAKKKKSPTEKMYKCKILHKLTKTNCKKGFKGILLLHDISPATSQQ